MRRVLVCAFCAVSGFRVLMAPALAAKYKPADFPLRVNIVFRNGIRHYTRMGAYSAASLDDVDGLGMADLFENGRPRGFQFNYVCSQPIMPTPGWATLMARWKKPDRVLEILMPVMGGKPGEMNSCDLKVNMNQGTVYVRHNSAVTEVPTAQFKKWMVRHDYDPEHGKDMPVNLRSAQPAAAPAPVN